MKTAGREQGKCEAFKRKAALQHKQEDMKILISPLLMELQLQAPHMGLCWHLQCPQQMPNLLLCSHSAHSSHTSIPGSAMCLWRQKFISHQSYPSPRGQDRCLWGQYLFVHPIPSCVCSQGCSTLDVVRDHETLIEGFMSWAEVLSPPVVALLRLTQAESRDHSCH